MLSWLLFQNQNVWFIVLDFFLCIYVFYGCSFSRLVASGTAISTINAFLVVFFSESKCLAYCFELFSLYILSYSIVLLLDPALIHFLVCMCNKASVINDDILRGDFLVYLVTLLCQSVYCFRASNEQPSVI